MQFLGNVNGGDAHNRQVVITFLTVLGIGVRQQY